MLMTLTVIILFDKYNIECKIMKSKAKKKKQNDNKTGESTCADD